MKAHPTGLLRAARLQARQEACDERQANLKPFARAVRAETKARVRAVRAEQAAIKAAARRSRAQRGAK